MAVVGALVAVLAEGAPEFRNDRNHRIAPLPAQLLGQGRQAFPEAVDIVGQGALRRTFVHVRIPATDVDEPDPVLVAHQAPEASCLELEPLRGDGIATGLLHFLHDPADLLA